jgi:uncharacterized protein
VFHYRGAWGSGGAYSFTHMLEDVDATLAFLRAPDRAAAFRVDPARIVLVGHSMGGFAALMVASRDPEVTAVASISGNNLGNTGETTTAPEASAAAARVLAGQLQPLAGASPEALVHEVVANAKDWQLKNRVSQLAAKSVLLVAGTRDVVVPKALNHDPLVEALRAANARHLTVKTLDADHSYSDKRIALTRTLAEWLAGLER